MTELSDISGVGPSRADALRDAGFESAEDVADAPLAEVEEALDSSADPDNVRTNARDAVGYDDDTSDEATDPRSRTRTLDVPDREMAFYLVKGLVDENLRLTKRNEYDDVDHVNELIDRLVAEIGDDGGSIEVDLDDLSVLYTSIRNVENEFQGTRGLTELTGTARDVRVEIQDLRSELWPDS